MARALKQPKNTGRKTGQLRTNRKAGLTKLAKQADIVVEVGLTRRGVLVGFLESLLQTCHSALQFCRLHALATERQDSFFPDGSEELVPGSFVWVTGFRGSRLQWIEAVASRSGVGSFAVDELTEGFRRPEVTFRYPSSRMVRSTLPE